MRLVGFIVRRNFVGCFYIMGMIDAQKIDALILLASCMTYTIAVCTVKNSLMVDRGTVRNM